MTVGWAGPCRIKVLDWSEQYERVSVRSTLFRGMAAGVDGLDESAVNAWLPGLRSLIVGEVTSQPRHNSQHHTTPSCKEASTTPIFIAITQLRRPSRNAFSRFRVTRTVNVATVYYSLTMFYRPNSMWSWTLLAATVIETGTVLTIEA